MILKKTKYHEQGDYMSKNKKPDVSYQIGTTDIN